MIFHLNFEKISIRQRFALIHTHMPCSVWPTGIFRQNCFASALHWQRKGESHIKFRRSIRGKVKQRREKQIKFHKKFIHSIASFESILIYFTDFCGGFNWWNPKNSSYCTFWRVFLKILGQHSPDPNSIKCHFLLGKFLSNQEFRLRLTEI